MKKLLFITPVLFLISCVKDHPDEQYELINRYYKAAEIVALPGISYDGDGSPPDIRIDIKRRSAGFWEFSTFTENNAGFIPIYTVFPSEVLATDEMWEIRIVDEDLQEAEDDEIFYWQFHAVEDGERGKIEFFGDGRLVMILRYNEK